MRLWEADFLAGRHFASIEILTFIAAFVMSFDVVIVEDTLGVDYQRIGLGVQQTRGKFMVRLE